MSTTASRLSADARREQLLEVAIDAFAKSGYHSTSMNDVAAAAGVTKPVLYQHFDSKRALYVALLEDVGDRITSAVLEATKNTDSGKETTRLGFIAYFTWVAEHPREFQLLFGSNDRTDVEFTAMTRKLESSLAEAIAPLITAGIDAQHQRTLALGLIALAIGVSQHLIAEGKRFNPETIAEQVFQFAWAGLRSVGR
jgi:AcrR family transcriptional regulator